MLITESGRKEKKEEMSLFNVFKKKAKGSALEVPALGRSVELGELYDARADQVGPGMLQARMADDVHVTKHARTFFKRFKEDEVSSISSSWGISADLHAGVLSEAVQCGGSVRYLNDRGRFSCRYSTALKVTMETETRQLDKPCESYCKRQNAADRRATHFVYKIQYGAEGLFLFSKDTERRKTLSELGGGVSLKLQLPVGFSVEAEKKKQSSDHKDVFQCEFYGDFRLDALPRSYQEAQKLCKVIPGKLKTLPYTIVYCHTLHTLQRGYHYEPE